ncbi:hypothetical protein M446_1589 [Methylobacterium sp. 4-46]|uniref:hypothetical protein n=1 Tax=unclassified Methylobacterium TaxID=2615210 RepID=UPI000165CA53|nr:MULTISPECIES: hypothetical protein [Methylobacterium]ACA16089.1 hypothetical protein M446_1589 [Methylobacterium sp. 4-46]WFT81800.1 hypothetical protein QA634_08055 [Methylobacterium nodulans]
MALLYLKEMPCFEDIESVKVTLQEDAHRRRHFTIDVIGAGESDRTAIKSAVIQFLNAMCSIYDVVDEQRRDRSVS